MTDPDAAFLAWVFVCAGYAGAVWRLAHEGVGAGPARDVRPRRVVSTLDARGRRRTARSRRLYPSTAPDPGRRTSRDPTASAYAKAWSR